MSEDETYTEVHNLAVTLSPDNTKIRLELDCGITTETFEIDAYQARDLAYHIDLLLPEGG